MKKSLIALAVMGASTVAFAASNVTLYGVIEEGVVVQKAKHQESKSSEMDILLASFLNRVLMPIMVIRL